MNVRRLCISTMMFLALGARAARAQDSAKVEPARAGFYASLGFAWGSCGSGCTGNGSTQLGRSGYWGLGGTIDPHWRAGVEMDWVQSMDPIPFMVMFAYYPSLTNDLWFKAGIGSAFATVGGTSGAIGMGYDWHPGHASFALMPFATYVGQFNGSGSGFLVGIGFGQRH